MNFEGLLNTVAREAAAIGRHMEQAARTAEKEIDAKIPIIAQKIRDAANKAAAALTPPAPRATASNSDQRVGPVARFFLPPSENSASVPSSASASSSSEAAPAPAAAASSASSSAAAASSSSEQAAAQAVPQDSPNLFFDRDVPDTLLTIISDYMLNSNDSASHVELVGLATVLPENIADKVLVLANFDVNRFVTDVLKRHSATLDPLPADMQAVLSRPVIRNRFTNMYLSVFSINDAELRSILTRAQQFPNLKDLDISGGHRRGITNSSIALVAELLPDLHYINLSDNSQINSHAVDSLLRMTQLKGVFLRGCRGVDQGAKDRLRAKFGPDVIRS